MLEAFTLLGALATVTERVTLGTLVLNVAHRRPAVTAVGAATVSAISGRPVLLGLGAGASPASAWSTELRAVDQPIEPSLVRRHDAVVEVIEACRRLWAEDRPVDLATVPRPMPRSAIHVGASGPRLAAIAGRLADGVNVPWHHPRRRLLLETARRERRPDDRRPFEVTTYLPWAPELLDGDHPDRRAMAAEGVHRLILLVREPDSLDDLERSVISS